MIYCLEDEGNIRELIVYTLKSSGFEAQGFEKKEELFSQLEKRIPQLILLDIMLPGADGLVVLKELKSMSGVKDIPVIMVTAKGAEYDKAVGLDMGADDYIVKPFGMMEFVARIRAVLRRADGGTEKGRRLEMGNVRLDIAKHQVYLGDEKIRVTCKEFELLKHLLEHMGIVLTRNQLLDQIWGYDFDGETRTVDVHVRSLRQKLGNEGSIIETVRGIGYRIGD